MSTDLAYWEFSHSGALSGPPPPSHGELWLPALSSVGWGAEEGVQFSPVPSFREEHGPESLDRNLGVRPGLISQSLSITGPQAS